ncbi:MAG: non-ribosomal peptide synthetase [Bacteroidota bacterium]
MNIQPEYTLVDLLLEVQNEQSRGVHFVKSHETLDFVSYGQLYKNALNWKEAFGKSGISSGQEVVIQIEDNQSFLNCFWALVLGGNIPIPLSVGNQDNQKAKLFTIWDNLDSAWYITDSKNYQRIESYALDNDLEDKLEEIRPNVILFDELSIENSSKQHDNQVVKPEENDIGYIQYSSGSTGSPKGVILTHKNLITNINDIRNRYEVSLNDSALSWMPLTHDMGLICFHLTSLLARVDQYILPTSLFIRRPTLWIELASQYGITELYSPNFGYQYFLNAYERLDHDQLEWDLSKIRLIYNGAEPISHELCELFVNKMATYGLNKNSMYPGYGLAEASVAVSLPILDSEHQRLYLNRDFLSIGDEVKEIPFQEGDEGVSFVTVGRPIDNCQVRICDDNDHVCSQNTIGHIQIKGGNVTAGYYKNQEATSKLLTGDGWVRTGDLGFFHGEELVVTGRLKNIIILNGQNYYPQDFERAVEHIEGLELGKVVACGSFNPELKRDEVLVFVLNKGKLDKFIPTITKVKEEIYNKVGVTADHIIPIRQIPKTTSGKIQHYKLSSGYRKGEYADTVAKLSELTAQAQGSILETLTSTFYKLTGRTINGSDNLLDVGLNSLVAMQLVNHIQDVVGKQLTINEIFNNITVEELASSLENKENTQSVIQRSPESEYYPLREGQKRFWYLPIEPAPV